MTVPPPQTNINIELVSKAAPKVENVEINDDVVTVTFDKFIDPATVSNIKLTDGSGNELEYTLDYSKSETNAAGPQLKHFLSKASLQRIQKWSDKMLAPKFIFFLKLWIVV